MILSDQDILTHQPQRIVSLVPSQTELLFDLGLEKETIGITKFCIHPEEWFRSKSRIGGTKSLHLDKIRDLKPDLILANKEENIQEQVEALAKEFPVWVSDIKNLKDALFMINHIGALTQKISVAEKIAHKIKIGFESLEFLAKNSTALRVAYLIWKEPLMTIGTDTFIHELLNRSGFKNIFEDKIRYPTTTLEELIQRDFDYLFLSSEPYPFKEKDLQYFQKQFPSKKIILVDGELFSWYGSRLQLFPSYVIQLHSELTQ